MPSLPRGREPGAPETTDTDDLFRCAAAGDDRAWEELVARHIRLLHWIARRCGLTAEQTEDAVQTTWLRLMENYDRIREPQRLAAWLAMTMRREAIRLSSGARRELPVDDRTGFPRVADLTDTARVTTAADSRLMDSETRRLLWDVVDELPPRHRDLIQALFAPDAPSYLDVSSRLSLAIGSIGPLRGRALSQLRVLIDDLGLVEDLVICA